MLFLLFLIQSLVRTANFSRVLRNDIDLTKKHADLIGKGVAIFNVHSGDGNQHTFVLTEKLLSKISYLDEWAELRKTFMLYQRSQDALLKSFDIFYESYIHSNKKSFKTGHNMSDIIETSFERGKEVNELIKEMVADRLEKLPASNNSSLSQLSSASPKASNSSLNSSTPQKKPQKTITTPGRPFTDSKIPVPCSHKAQKTPTTQRRTKQSYTSTPRSGSNRTPVTPPVSPISESVSSLTCAPNLCCLKNMSIMIMNQIDLCLAQVRLQTDLLNNGRDESKPNLGDMSSNTQMNGVSSPHSGSSSSLSDQPQSLPSSSEQKLIALRTLSSIQAHLANALKEFKKLIGSSLGG
ncbi:hypothetical protein THOM_0355 [Trachipleistophora hominis]|uniref:Uncharacterized protein n=1 Tax=Trachipleistophora hominis TaxID=72359 RepID=L7K007_TRAHO|nr:hypothetical protein THOM_0355 [Trachipleistophora hominis]